MLTIDAEKRDIFGKKLKSTREEGKLPAVVYGPKEETTPLVLDVRKFLHIWGEAGETTVVSLNLKGVGEKEVMIHNVDIDPVGGNPIHADFYAIEKGKKIHVHVPLEFDGIAPAVKEHGGTLVKVLHEIEVESLPKDIPHEIKIDISGLIELDSHILVKDIKLPEGVGAITKGDEVIVSVAAPREEEEEEETPIDLSEIEVEKRGKAEGEVLEGEDTEKGDESKQSK